MGSVARMSDPSVSETELLRRLIARDDLARADVAELFGRIMDGAVAEPMIAALLVALASKGETPEEIAGAAEAMRARARRVPHRRDRVLDTCGTGGDGRGTFNVSTAAAFVAAAAGAPVAKHGNRAISSRSGSADLLAALGVPVEVEPELSGRQLDEIGLAFLFAPLHHPATKAVAPVRRALGVRTVFNLLGPLTNPAGALRQLVGVYAAERVEPVARVLGLGCEHASSSMAATASTRSRPPRRRSSPRCATARCRPSKIRPNGSASGARRPRRVAGGTPEENAAPARVRAGRRARPAGGDRRPAKNAGAALYVAGLVARPPRRRRTGARGSSRFRRGAREARRVESVP